MGQGGDFLILHIDDASLLGFHYRRKQSENNRMVQAENKKKMLQK